jgi:hypothetical protein
MLRRARVLLLVVMAVGLISSGGSAGDPPASAPTPARELKAGDRVKVVGVAAPASVDELTYRAWGRAHTLGSDAIVADMRASRRVVDLPVGTHVLVMRRVGHRQEYGYVGHPEGRVYAAVPLPDLAGSPRDPIEVRILDGDYKGQVRFVPEDAVAVPPPPQSQPADPATRAATTLRSAQNLEKAGKTLAALGIYRQIVRDHPGTPEAKAAAERIKALDGK